MAENENNNEMLGKSTETLENADKEAVKTTEKQSKAKNDKKDKKVKEKKPSKLAAKFKGLKSEYKKITWASKEDTFKNFAIVLVGMVVFAAVIGVIDLGLGSFFNFLLKNISFDHIKI